MAALAVRCGRSAPSCLRTSGAVHALRGLSLDDHRALHAGLMLLLLLCAACILCCVQINDLGASVERLNRDKVQLEQQMEMEEENIGAFVRGSEPWRCCRGSAAVHWSRR